MMQQQYLYIDQIVAAYDDGVVVDGVSFGVDQGELACLLGPSGCGKTTILRSIAGFQPLLEGEIHLDNKLLSNNKKQVPAEKRGVGMVFQDHALFPHLNVADNISFGLRKLRRSEKKAKIAPLLEMAGLMELAEKYPHELSGGQSQRVALARAIAPEPKLLLLDEPFSNLDTELRESLGYEIRALLKDLGVTAIMVTHDQHDAFALGDKVGVLSAGKLMQWDSSFNLYHAPDNRFVADFIGDGVFVKGQMMAENTVVTGFGEISGESVNGDFLGKQVDLLIRPDDVLYDASGPLLGTVERKAFKGAQTLYTIRLISGDEVLSLVPSHDDYEIGDEIKLRIEADHLVCFDTAD